jgi:hypothetical protein
MPTKITTERRQLNEGLVQDIKEIKSILVEMQKIEAVRSERDAINSKKIEDINHIVNGNAKPGLVKDVLLLQESDKARAEREKRNTALIYTVTAAVIIQIILAMAGKL